MVAGEVTVKNMRSRQQQRVPLTSLTSYITSLLSHAASLGPLPPPPVPRSVTSTATATATVTTGTGTASKSFKLQTHQR
jgi:hypothetical protein